MSMDVLDAIHERRSVRHFTLAPVDGASVRALLDAAVQAPSARNRQPWSFVVIQDRQWLKQVSERAVAALRSDPQWAEAFAFMGPAQDIFHGAGTLIVICTRANGFAPVGDCYLAAQNLMLAACGMGLATCPIGLARDTLGAADLRAAMRLPADEQPVLPIAVGWPAGATPATQRDAPRIHAWLAAGD